MMRRYLFRLADAMRGMSVVDEELYVLEANVRARLQLLEAGSADNDKAGTAAIEDGGGSNSSSGRAGPL